MIGFLKKNKEEVICAVIFLFFALGFNIYRVQSDGVIYYAFLEKMLFIPNPETQPQFLEKVLFIQSGCVYFNAPFYLMGYAIENIFNLKIDFNGITLRQISINLASNFYMLCSLFLTIKILKKLNYKYIILPVLSVLFSTTAFSAAVIIPSFSHAVDIFVTTLFFYLFFKYKDERPFKSIWLGILYLITTLVRYFNVAFLMPIIIYYLMTKEYRKIGFLLLGFLGSVWIFPLLHYIYNGAPLPFYQTGLTALRIKTLNMVPVFPKYMLKFLVHPVHGIFVWSPVTIFSAFGLFVLVKPKQKIWIVLILPWVLYLLLCGYIHAWNAGWSFSNRYLVSLFPIYVIGLSALLERYGRKIVWLVVLATAYSVVLFLNWHLCILHPEFDTPASLIKIWTKGESLCSVDKKVSLKIFFYRLWEYCRYKYLFRIFK